MSYRDDTAAAQARAEAAEHEQRKLDATNARLTSELAGAKEWLGGSRRRWIVGSAIAAVLAIAAGFAIGRFTGTPLADDRPPAAHEPFMEVSGTLVVLGVDFGRGAAKASTCYRRGPNAADISILGTGGHSVLVTPGAVTLTFAHQPHPLTKAHCTRLAWSISDSDGVAGSVDFDCTLDGNPDPGTSMTNPNRIVGRFAFSHCR